MMRTRQTTPGRGITSLLLALTLFFCLTGAIYAAPPLPSSFYGEAGESGLDAAEGATVSASISGSIVAQTTVFLDGGRALYRLDVLGDDPDTLAIEGGQPGDQIIFQIDGVEADQTALWQAGSYTRLALSTTQPQTPPIAQPINITTAEEVAAGVLLTGTDANNAPLTFRVVDGPSNGSLAGTPPYLIYTPEPNFAGTDSFTYVANNGIEDSALASVVLNVSPVNDPPVFVASVPNVVLNEGESATRIVTAGDVDGDALQLTAGSLPNFAILVDRGDGSAELTLSPGFGHEGSYSIEIRADDGTNQAILYFTVVVLAPDQNPLARFAPDRELNVARGSAGAAVVDFSSVGSGTPDGIIDDNNFTSWLTANGATADQFITIDLVGDLQQIDRVVLKGLGALDSPRHFEIAVSATGADAGDFTTVFAGEMEKRNAFQTFGFATVSARYVQVRLLDNYGSGTRIALANLQVLTRQRQGGIVSVADGDSARVVDLSSQANSTSRSATQAINFETTNFWQTGSGAVTDQYLTVELREGQTYTIDRIFLRAFNGATDPRHFQLRVAPESTDGTVATANFVTVLSGELLKDGLPHWFTFDPVEARYVQLFIQNNHGSSASIRLKQLEIYGVDLGGEEVPFSDDSVGRGVEIVDWQWDFGDGNTSTLQHPTHTYAAPGSYQVTLTVTDSAGAVGSTTMTYTVLTRPSLAFSVDRTEPVEGDTLRFEDQSVLTGDRLLMARTWQFSHTLVEPTTQTAVQSFQDNGIYTVTLVYLDSEFLITQVSQPISVANLPPVASAGEDQIVPLQEVWQAQATVMDPSPADQSALSCAWDFGDGESVQISTCNGSTVNVTHTYVTPGIYTATLTLWDKDGASNVDTTVATVRKRATTLAITQIESLSDTTAQVELMLRDMDGAAPMAGFPIALTWDGVLVSLTTDSDGRATTILPVGPEQEVDLAAAFGGDGVFQATTTTVRASAESLIEYWLAFPTNSGNIANGGFTQIQLRISGAQESSGYVQVAGLNLLIPFVVRAGETTLVPLPRQVLVTLGESVTENKGILVRALTDVEVYAYSLISATTDGYYGLSTEHLGTEYRVLSRDGLLGGSEYTILAAEDNTAVTVTPTLGAPFSLQLDQGQLFQAKINGGDSGDFTGTRISASLPVAVFSGHQCGYVPDSVLGQYCNHMVEQLFPVNTLGQEFVVIPFDGRPKFLDYIRVVASQDQTTVNLNGAQVAVLAAGTIYEQPFSLPLHITTSHPVLVGQFATGVRSGLSPGDPTLILVPPVEQFAHRYPAVSVGDLPYAGTYDLGTYAANYRLSILARMETTGTITINGVPVPVEDFTPIGDSDFAGAYVPVAANQTNFLAGPRPFGAMVYGFSNQDDAFGYLAGRIVISELTVTPPDAIQILGQEQCVTAQIGDQRGRPVRGVDVHFATQGVHSENGVGRTDSEGAAAFCYTGTQVGLDTIQATILELAASASITWQLAPVNDAPTAGDDSAVTDEDTAVSIDVLANDGDPDGDVLMITQAGVPTHGTAQIDGATLVYTPAADFAGSDAFTYTISDGEFTATAMVNVTVNPVNEAPTAGDDSAVTDEETAVSIDVLVNDGDPDGDVLLITQVGVPTHGTAQIDGTTLVYTPAADFAGSDAFTYTISDGEFTATAMVNVTVNPVNEAPTAGDDSAVTDEDTAVSIDVLANDGDPDGDVLLITQVGTPSHGMAQIDGATLVYTPAADFAGSDAFTYTISDGEFTATAMVNVTVNPVNEAPTAGDDSAVTDEETAVSIDVLVNDGDPDGDALLITQVGTPSHGMAQIDGTTLVYTPAADFAGSDAFTYTVSDGEFTATAAVNVAVNPVNDAPTAIDDEVFTEHNLAVTIPVLANDVDIDSPAIILVDAGQPVTGTVVVNLDGTVTYTPDADFYGVDSFVYTISDGELQATGTVIVSVELPAVVVCALYPVALPADTIVNAAPGSLLPDIFSGGGPGNFGWLSWSGNPNVPTLVNNLTPPGNSDTYVNPYDQADHLISLSDWVQGEPGVSNSKKVREALDELIGLSITVPVWGDVQGQGNNLNYQITDFAQIRLVSYNLGGENRMTVEYLGSTICGETSDYANRSGASLEEDASGTPGNPADAASMYRVFLPLMAKR